MTLSTATANALLNHTFTNVNYAQPTAWWVQLHYGNPGNVGTGSAWTAAGRVLCSDWETSDSGWLRNAVDVLWDVLPNPGDNDDISYFSIWSLAASGTCIGYGSLESQSTAIPVASNGEPFLIPRGLLFVKAV